MKDGVDHKAFSAEIKALPPEARRGRMREFGEWMREASHSTGRRPYIGLIVTGIAVAILALGLALQQDARQMVPFAIVVMMIGTWFNWDSARRARVWRRAHPFEQWRSAR